MIRSIEVDLTKDEMRRANAIGFERWMDSRLAGYPAFHGDETDNDATWTDSLGAMGEVVIANVTGYEINRSDGPDRGAADVGPWHVRTNPRFNGDLFLHKADDDDGAFVLVVGPVVCDGLFRFWIRGWCYAKQGKIDDYWNRKIARPCYCVPKLRLEQFEPGLEP